MAEVGHAQHTGSTDALLCVAMCCAFNVPKRYGPLRSTQRKKHDAHQGGEQPGGPAAANPFSLSEWHSRDTSATGCTPLSAYSVPQTLLTTAPPGKPHSLVLQNHSSMPYGRGPGSQDHKCWSDQVRTISWVIELEPTTCIITSAKQPT